MSSSSRPLWPEIEGARARKLPSCNSANATARLASAVPQSACATQSGSHGGLCSACASARRRRVAASWGSTAAGFESTAGMVRRAMPAPWTAARLRSSPVGLTGASLAARFAAARLTASSPGASLIRVPKNSAGLLLVAPASVRRQRGGEALTRLTIGCRARWKAERGDHPLGRLKTPMALPQTGGVRPLWVFAFPCANEQSESQARDGQVAFVSPPGCRDPDCRFRGRGRRPPRFRVGDLGGVRGVGVGDFFAMEAQWPAGRGPGAWTRDIALARCEASSAPRSPLKQSKGCRRRLR
jgi:hypothetical protein